MLTQTVDYSLTLSIHVMSLRLRIKLLLAPGQIWTTMDVRRRRMEDAQRIYLRIHLRMPDVIVNAFTCNKRICAYQCLLLSGVSNILTLYIASIAKCMLFSYFGYFVYAAAAANLLPWQRDGPSFLILQSHKVCAKPLYKDLLSVTIDGCTWLSRCVFMIIINFLIIHGKFTIL